MFRSTFLLQIFFLLCFSLKYFIKIVRLVLAAVSANGLRYCVATDGETLMPMEGCGGGMIFV